VDLIKIHARNILLYTLLFLFSKHTLDGIFKKDRSRARENKAQSISFINEPEYYRTLPLIVTYTNISAQEADGEGLVRSVAGSNPGSHRRVQTGRIRSQGVFPAAGGLAEDGESEDGRGRRLVIR